MAFFNYQNPYQPYPYQPQMQMQMPVQPQQPLPQPVQPQQTTLYGQMVDSIDAARSKDIDMSGNPRYYPNINGNEIYVKQLQADGTCPVVVYRRDSQTQNVIEQKQEQDNEMKKILEELQNIKTLMQNGGVQNGKHNATHEHD